MSYQLGEHVTATHRLARIKGTIDHDNRHNPAREEYGRSHPLYSTRRHFDKTGWELHAGEASTAYSVSWWLIPCDIDGIVVAQTRVQYGLVVDGADARRSWGEPPEWYDPVLDQKGSFLAYYVADKLGAIKALHLIPERPDHAD